MLVSILWSLHEFDPKMPRRGYQRSLQPLTSTAIYSRIPAQEMQKKSGVMQSMEVHRSWPTDQTVPPFFWRGAGRALWKSPSLVVWQNLWRKPSRILRQLMPFNVFSLVNNPKSSRQLSYLDNLSVSLMTSLLPEAVDLPLKHESQPSFRWWFGW